MTTQPQSGPTADLDQGPLSELVTTLWQWLADNLPRDLTWPVLSVTLLIATSIWLLRDGRGAKTAAGRERKTGLLQFLLPKDIFTHPSARVDVALYLFERLIRPLWVLPFVVAIAPLTEHGVITALASTLGTGPQLESSYAWMLLYSLVTLLLYDGVFYLIHYVEHKNPALWAIHKIHHSAEVLTPLTRYREHFIEGPIYAIGAALAYGIAGAFSVGFFWAALPRPRCSTWVSLPSCLASMAHSATTTLLSTTPGGCRAGCTVRSCITSTTVTCPSTTTKIWPRSPVFGTGCLAPFTSPRGMNTHHGGWGLGSSNTTVHLCRTQSAPFGNGI